MPESAERSCERKRRAREAARRREAVGVLRIIQATARYAADQIDGADPGLARSAALEAAAEMDAAAVALRRLVRLRPDERRSLAPLLAGRGLSRVQIGMALGLSERSVRKYLNGG